MVKFQFFMEVCHIVFAIDFEQELDVVTFKIDLNKFCLLGYE